MSRFGTEITSEDIVDTLSFFDSWEDRYKYIIDLGKELPELDPSQRTEENLVRGCQSQVWLVSRHEGDKLYFDADSDAFIVKGLLAVVLAAGLFTRWAAIVWLLMMVGFSIGVIYAWSQGLSIDCGCFGGGGDVAEGTTNYPVHMLERAGFIVLGLYLAIWPRSKFSVDSWLSPKPV